MEDKSIALDHALVGLYQLGLKADENTILQEGVERAVELIESTLGYVHLMNEDQRTIELVTWSRSTLKRCSAIYERHYDLDKAGLWADTVRLRQPVIHNDYPALPDRQGYPQGHAHVVRHLGVPVIAGDKVRLLIGVGNKAVKYTQQDCRLLQAVADVLWSLVANRRRLIELKTRVGVLNQARQLLSFIGWTWDSDDDLLEWHGAFSHLVPEREQPRSLAEFIELVTPDCRDRLRNLLQNPDQGSAPLVLDLRIATRNDEAHPFKLVGASEPRPRGQGFIFQGILQDSGIYDALKHAQHAALHDPLTNLLNREGFRQNAEGVVDRSRRRIDSHGCLLLIDLDNFKPINDRFGHPVGDLVLCEMARRMSTFTRSYDLAGRFGGDEFLILLRGLIVQEEIETLVNNLLDDLMRPVDIDGHRHGVMMSIGIARYEPGSDDFSSLFKRADLAMYKAKADPDRRFYLDAGSGHRPRRHDGQS